jgi:hypothetical protein
MQPLNIFLAEATDPVTLSLSVAAGIVCRRWWHVAVACVVIVTVSEALLFIARPTHKFNLTSFSIAALVPVLLVSLILAIKKYRARHDTASY